ncbi:MAG: hypothetical protein N5P05_004177 (plasmid) [Chroococcopsis gigantea SAG 12.99]|jgi:5-methylcytosine-specific restriction endonuclease McrA|nr:hypothetical protein [Chroococcopsis gigantea SAG 12.99]
MAEFLEIDPSGEDYWRAIVLFGQNTACYKFALAKSLLEIAPTGKTLVTLADLAVPYSRHITEHLLLTDKQATSKSSQFLDVCRRFNAGEIGEDELVEATINMGFVNVLDAFHNLRSGQIPVSFFDRSAWKKSKQIVLTDELLAMAGGEQFGNLAQEAEGRWRLVETAWSLDLSRNLVLIDFDPDSEMLVTSNRRVNITSCRSALDGYQKGKCFYCFAPVSLVSGSDNLTQVDHFFPHRLRDYIKPINGVWNLVLSCRGCNAGKNGKSDRIACLPYLERLHTRNEFLIGSHHPLRETLIQQTGNSEGLRRGFLQRNYTEAQRSLGVNRDNCWKPVFEYPQAF